MRRDLSKEELVALMRHIMNAEGTEEEIDEMITLFDAYEHRQEWQTISEYNPSPE